MASFINAGDASEVVLGSSTTMLIRILADSMGRTLSDGDEIIVTNCDHEANIGAWRELGERGVAVKTWELNRDSFRLEIDDLLPHPFNLVCHFHY